MAFKIKNFYGSPLHSKGFTISLSEKDIKNEKSASSKPAAKLENTEGQGGYDYEKQKGEMNFPGDDGYDTLENSMDKDGISRKSGSYLSAADVKRKQKKADKKFSKVSAKNSDKKNLRKAKAGLKVEGQIVDKEIKDRKKINKS